MKKKEIVDLINKNKNLMELKQIMDIPDLDLFYYFCDQYNISPRKIYDKVQELTSALRKEKCSCELIEHRYDQDDDSLFTNYPYNDECVLCHRMYYSPRINTVRMVPANYMRNGEPKIARSAPIQYNLYNAILKLLENYDDEDEISLTHLYNEILKQDDFLPLISINKTYVDLRKKDNYNVLIIAGSNNIDVNGINLKPLEYRGVSSFLNRLIDIPNTKITLVSSDLRYQSQSGIQVLKYDTSEELENILKEKSDTTYDLVIDLSNLKECEIKDGHVLVKPYSIKTKINADYYVRLKDINGLNDKKILKTISSTLHDSETYGYDYSKVVPEYYGSNEKDDYFYENSGKMESVSLNDLLRHVEKRMLKEENGYAKRKNR